MYKVGDKVICVENINSGVVKGEGWKLGLIFTIERISKGSHNREILWPGNRGNGVLDDYVRHLNWKARFGGEE